MLNIKSVLKTRIIDLDMFWCNGTEIRNQGINVTSDDNIDDKVTQSTFYAPKLSQALAHLMQKKSKIYRTSFTLVMAIIVRVATRTKKPQLAPMFSVIVGGLLYSYIFSTFSALVPFSSEISSA